MTPELEEKIREALIQWLNSSDIQDDFTAGYLAGRASVLEQLEQVAHTNYLGDPVEDVLLGPDTTLYRLSPQLEKEKK